MNPYGFMLENAISTITFYKGDFNLAVNAIRAQFLLVVAANPWLAGRLVSTKDGIRLRYPAKPSETDLDSLFKALDTNDIGAVFKLTPNTPYSKMTKNMFASNKFIVQKGNDCLDNDLPIALLNLSESEKDKFALVLSLCHVVGDGRTYYEIFKMLQPGAIVRELIIKRIQSFSEEVKDLCVGGRQV